MELQSVLLAVDSDGEVLAALDHDLTRRFAGDYRIVTAETPAAALVELDADDEVAVVIAGQWLSGTTGIDFLSACHQLHPAAKRLLLITNGDSSVARLQCVPWRWVNLMTKRTSRGQS